MKIKWHVLFLFILIAPKCVESQVIDESFLPLVKGLPRVHQVFVLPDGKLIVSGDITMTRDILIDGIVRLNPDGSYDNSFDHSSFPKGQLYDVLYDNITNHIYLAGDFDDSDDIIRMDYDGQIDNTFRLHSGITSALDVEMQSSGKLIVLSKSNEVGIARLHEDGSLDNSFNNNLGADLVNNVSSDMKVLANDKIAIGGRFTQFNSIQINNLVLLNSDGSFDLNFDFGSGFVKNNFPWINSIIEMPDETLIICGSFEKIQEKKANGLAKILPNGSIDPKFELQGITTSFFSRVDVLKAIKDMNGKIVLTGRDFFEYKVARINEDGTIDNDFSQGTLKMHASSVQFVNIPALGISPNNELYFGADQSSYNGFKSYGLTKIDEFGNPTVFNSKLGGKASINSAESLSDGRVIIGGDFISVNDFDANYLAMINSNGSVNKDFHINMGSGPNQKVNVIKVNNESDILVGGSFDSFSSMPREGLVKISPQGNLDNTFNPEIQIKYYSYGVSDIHFTPENDIIVGGIFEHSDVELNGIAKFNKSGVIDFSFSSLKVLPTDTWVRDIEMFDNSKILLACDYDFNSDFKGGEIVKLNMDGSIHEEFDRSYDFSGLDVIEVEIMPDQSIMAASFNRPNASPLLQFDENGFIKDEEAIEVKEGYITTIYPIGNNSMLLGGNMESLNNIETNGLIKVSLTGETDGEFNYDFKTFSDSFPERFAFPFVENFSNPFINGIKLISDNSFLLYGSFLGLGDNQCYNVIKLNINPLSTPSNLTGKFNVLKGVELNWSDNSFESAFEIFRSDSQNDYTLLAEVNEDESSYIDTNIIPELKYYYKVRAKSSNLYSNFSNTVTVVPSAQITSTEFEGTREFLIAPNPSSGIFYMSSHDELISSYKIFDINGRELANQQVDSHNVILRHRDLPNGFYLIQVFTSERVVSQRVVIKK